MEKAFITKQGQPRLIMLFLGWGMEPGPFRSLHKPGYDILALSDYKPGDADRLSDLRPLLRDYSEIVVVAWSFGVRIATSFLAASRGCLPITKSIAVNGTPAHIHDDKGIPRRIFEGTLSGLSEASVRKFRRRMFDSAAAFEAFAESHTSRSFASVRAELEAFAVMPPLVSPEDASLWDMAVVSDNDRIFPADNQRAAWSGIEVTELARAPHFPDFNHILEHYIINKNLMASRFASASSTYADHAEVQAQVAYRLWQRTKRALESRGLLPASILEVGVGSGTLTGLYAPLLGKSRLTLWDIAEVALPMSAPEGATLEICDAETAIQTCPEGSFDLIISASAIQWFHSPARFVAHLRHALTPGGVAALAFYGPGTFCEVETATGRSLSYPHLSHIYRTARQCGLTVIDSHSETHILSFENQSQVLRHLKLTGVNALADDDDGARRSAIRLMRSFPLQPDGTATLTYAPAYILLSNDTPEAGQPTSLHPEAY